MKMFAEWFNQLNLLRFHYWRAMASSRSRLAVLLIAAILLLVRGVWTPPVFAQEATDASVAASPGGETQLQGETGQKAKGTPDTKKDEHLLDEIVVTATRTAKSIADAPASVSVVTHEDIENRNIQSADTALNLIPGVFNKRSKDLDTTASVTLHGIPDQKRTLVLIDGQPVNGGYSGDVNWNGVDPDSIERIEVAKGPFSSLYGGNAMGGVINVITRMPEKREVVVKGGYGSDDFWTTYGSYGDRISDKLSIFASYGYKASDGYPTQLVVKTPSTPGSGLPVRGAIPTTTSQGAPAYIVGDRGDNNWSRDSANFKLAYDINQTSKATLSFMRSNYGYGYGDPHSYLTDTSGAPVFSGSVLVDNPQQLLKLSESNFLAGGGFRTENIGNLGYETKLFDDAVLKVNCGILDRERDGYVTPSSTATRKDGPGTYRDTPSDSVNTDVQMLLPVLDKHLLTFGAAFRYDQADSKQRLLTNWNDNDTKTDLSYQAKGKDEIFSFYTQAEISILQNLTGYLGVRGDYWETFDGYVNQVGSAGYPQEFGGSSSFSANPKGALVFKPNDSLSFRAEAGTSFRPPNIYELYSTWSYYGVTYASNPNLKPETCVSYDFGLDQKLGPNTMVRTSFFYNELHDLIYLHSISSTYQKLVNAGKARTYGAELEVERKVFGCLTLFGSLTVTQSEMLSNPANPESEGKQLVGVPLFQYSVGGEFKRGPFSLTLTGRYASKQYNSDTNSDTASGVYGSYDAYFITDVFARYQLTKSATLTFAVNNLFDRDYFTYYQAPGRQLFGGVSFKF